MATATKEKPKKKAIKVADNEPSTEVKVESKKKVSRVSEAIENLRTLIRARTPIIYVISDEKEKSFLEILYTMCEEGTSGSRYKKELFTWDCQRGFAKHSYVDGKPTPDIIEGEWKDPITVLEGLQSFKGNSEAGNLDHIYVLSEFHHYLTEVNVQRLLRLFSEYTADAERKSIIMLSTKNAGIRGKSLPPELENLVYLVDWPYPDSVYIENSLTKSMIPNLNKRLKREDPPIPEMEFSPEKIGELVGSCKGMTQKQIREACVKSIVVAKTLDPNIIAAEKKQIIKKSGICDFVEPSFGLSEIGGLDNLKDWLRQRKESMSEDAIDFGCDLPKGLLCVGPWGSGKTTVAKAIITEWGLPGLRIDVSRMFGMYVGESEGRTKELLNLADSVSPCALWWDEVENIFTNNGQSNSGTDGGTSSRVLGLISTWMSEHKGLVFNIFTANDISDSPPKLFRKGRLDELFVIDLPVKEERKIIFEIHLRKRLKKQNREHLIESIDLDLLAEYSFNFSGAEIENTVSTAILNCYVDDKREITTEDILEPVKNLIPMSSTMNESITRIRNWQEGRAIRASKYKAEEIKPNRNEHLSRLDTTRFGTKDSIENLEL